MAKGRYKEWQEPDKLTKLRGWARNGLIDEQIAHNIGISRSTLSDWKLKYPDIADALKKGKEVVDIEVENALLKRALGTTTITTIHKMVKVNDEVLKARRQRFLNEYKLDNPELSNKELQLIAIEKVPTYEKIPIQINETEVAPDTTAQIFWLKNRKPKEWRDRRETEISGGLDVNNPFKDLTADELRKLAKDD